MVVLVSFQQGLMRLSNTRAEVVNQLQIGDDMRIAASWTAEYYP